MAETLTQTAPAETQVQAPVQAEQPKPQESIITRASKVSLDQPQKTETQSEESIKVNNDSIEKIVDPALKQAVKDAYKSMESDYQRKMQDLASRRKEMDTLRAQLEQSGQYNPTKIQELLNNPSFVQAAQEYQKQITPRENVNSPLTQEEFSYLSPEQQKLYHSTQEAKNIAVNALTQAQQINQRAANQAEDSRLQQTYANYQPQTVDQVYNDMMTGKVQATREHLWKVADYDSAVNRAYQLGLQDRKIELGEKLNASSQPNNISVTPSSGDVPIKMPNESAPDYFRRIAQNAMRKVGVVK